MINKMKIQSAIEILAILCLFGFDNNSAKRQARPGFIWVCRQEPVDITFVLDASNSLGKANFTKGLVFIRDFLTRYEIGPDQVRVGAVLYSEGVFESESFGLNDHKNTSELLQAVLDLPYVGGLQTDTGLGIRYMRSEIMHDARPDVPRIGVVVTDGRSYDKKLTALEAGLARAQGLMMFAIGVGTQVSFQELVNIAGDPDNAFNVYNFDALETIKDKLEYRTCIEKLGPTPPPPPPCGVRKPSNIVFVMDTTSLTKRGVAGAAEFMSEVINHMDMAEGMQYGLISGICPEDEGFELGTIQNPGEVLSQLTDQSSDRMNQLLNRANDMLASDRYASDHAVIFYEKHVNVTTALRQFNAHFPNRVHVTMAVLAEPGAPQLGHVFDNVMLSSGEDMAELGRQFVEELCALD